MSQSFMVSRFQGRGATAPQGWMKTPGLREMRVFVTGYQPILPSSRYSISAFCTCMRFSASSQTTDCGPSMT